MRLQIRVCAVVIASGKEDTMLGFILRIMGQFSLRPQHRFSIFFNYGKEDHIIPTRAENWQESDPWAFCVTWDENLSYLHIIIRWQIVVRHHSSGCWADQSLK